jgi:membrane-associated phospholipid phosphatase
MHIAKIKVWRWRLLIVLAVFSLVLLVALTRMYLGVHYLSDVIAAFTEALAWLALCLTGMDTLAEYRAVRKKVG